MRFPILIKIENITPNHLVVYTIKSTDLALLEAAYNLPLIHLSERRKQTTNTCIDTLAKEYNINIASASNTINVTVLSRKKAKTHLQGVFCGILYAMQVNCNVTGITKLLQGDDFRRIIKDDSFSALSMYQYCVAIVRSCKEKLINISNAT